MHSLGSPHAGTRHRASHGAATEVPRRFGADQGPREPLKTTTTATEELTLDTLSQALHLSLSLHHLISSSHELPAGPAQRAKLSLQGRAQVTHTEKWQGGTGTRDSGTPQPVLLTPGLSCLVLGCAAAAHRRGAPHRRGSAHRCGAPQRHLKAEGQATGSSLDDCRSSRGQGADMAPAGRTGASVHLCIHPSAYSSVWKYTLVE